MSEIIKKNKLFISGAIILFSLIILYICLSKQKNVYALQMNVVRDKPKKRPKPIKNKIQLINIYASWCGWSKKLLPEWEKVEDYFKNNKNITVTKHEEKESKQLVNKLGVKGFPSIFIIKNGEVMKYPDDKPRSADVIIAHMLSM